MSRSCQGTPPCILSVQFHHESTVRTQPGKAVPSSTPALAYCFILAVGPVLFGRELPSGEVEYRELRWGDFLSYQKLMPQAPGEFERATGLDQATNDLFQYLHRRSTWTLLSLMRSLGRAPIRFFVGVDRGTVVGSAGLVPLPKAGYVVAVVTDYAARNRGIASTILEKIRGVVHAQGRPWIALDVESDNETAVRLYRKLGYEERARFEWHVGATPTVVAPAEGQVSEVPRSGQQELATWVRLHQPEVLREQLPATARMLSHLENVAQMPGSKSRTWRLTSSDKTITAVRGYYLPSIKSVFMIPGAWDPSLSADSILSLLAPAVAWARSERATRTEVVVPVESDAWRQAAQALSLPMAVSTLLMSRPSSP